MPRVWEVAWACKRKDWLKKVEGRNRLGQMYCLISSEEGGKERNICCDESKILLVTLLLLLLEVRVVHCLTIIVVFFAPLALQK